MRYFIFIGFLFGFACGLLFSSATGWAAEATLTWTANSEADLAGYKLYRATGTCPTGIITTAAIATLGKVANYVDTTVPAFDGQLCYEITAIDTTGNESLHSLRATKAVNLVPPVSPLGLGIVDVKP